jgi:hypothetical protein
MALTPEMKKRLDEGGLNEAITTDANGREVFDHEAVNYLVGKTWEHMKHEYDNRASLYDRQPEESCVFRRHCFNGRLVACMTRSSVG